MSNCKQFNQYFVNVGPKLAAKYQYIKKYFSDYLKLIICYI